MGERRKRKSMWDVEGETKVFPGVSENNSSHDFSSSQTSTRPKSGDQSGKPSLESNEEKNSVGGGNKYYRNMSPGFDGIEQHKYNHSIESDRSDTHRFLHSTNNYHGHISEDSNLWEDKGNNNVIYNNRASESGDVNNAEFIGEKNTDSNIQQQDHGVAQGNVLDEVNGLGYPAHPILLSGQDMNQNGDNVLLFSGHSSIFSNGFGSDLDRPEACLDLHSQMLKGQNDAQMSELVPVITQSIENARKSPNNTETEITNSQSSPAGDTGEVGNLTQPDNAKVDDPGNSKPKQENALGNPEADEGNNNNKVVRLFKNSLIEFVKEILKPTWKEGRLSREVHKTIVKKVVDKVTSTVQEDHIPKTQEKVDQYLLFSKPKIGKLVQAYVERSLRTDS